MLEAVRALDLNLNDRDLHPVGDFKPRIACDWHRVDRVGNHSVAEAQVVIGDRIADPITGVVK